ncbi:hypothetical protein F1737_05345 [Methanoplanus sp. FWC-SCC4]|uniref:Uncharacterized protein n=1 Tax=Methanochimaera problematica TaxID=2609417 RepID=A0AA97I4B6_9EURY|nr:hypothetical protein [Methanoplanus sp. FWC-SCC4]WOF16171.1 hypothetical protein F1737_05345 [Methanoplanus sp. FWC-SCC4]
MNPFKTGKEFEKDRIRSTTPPEIKDVILKHVNYFDQPVTVTSTLMALNRHGLNPTRALIKKRLDELAESGYVKVRKNGNISEYTPLQKKHDHK